MLISDAKGMCVCLFVTQVCSKFALVNAVSMYMKEDLWYPWKAFLVPQGVPAPQFKNRDPRSSAILKLLFSELSELTALRCYDSNYIHLGCIYGFTCKIDFLKHGELFSAMTR
jgi:hypothetical protein